MGRSNYAVVFAVALLVSVAMLPAAVAEEPPLPGEPPVADEPPLPSEAPATSPDDPDGPVEGDDDGEGPRRPPNPVKRYDVVRKLVFPVVGPTSFYAGFGACRDNCTREHHGIDIMSYRWKGLAVVAAHDGVVSRVTYDKGNAGCSVRIRARSGWETRYYHLNNDLPGTDTIGAPCPAKGIEVGVRVSAGQVIGWVGDSGNAETTPPHVHFELRMPNGHPVDPYKSLKKAEHITYEWLPSNINDATLAISKAYKPDPNGATIVVTTEEASNLSASEYEAMTLTAPVVAVDPTDPNPAIEEIARLGSQAILIMSDVDVRWLENRLNGLAPIIERMPMPQFDGPRVMVGPGRFETPKAETHIHDRFVTIIAGRIDRIWNSRQDEFEAFTVDHRSLVLESPSWGRKRLGQRSRVTPGRYADRTLLWWTTGDGWVGTESVDDIPPQGFAYVTERMATPWTLAYLASLTELDPMPVWRAR